MAEQSNDARERFATALRDAVAGGRLLKLTLSKPRRKSPELPLNLYVRPVELGGELLLHCVYRYADREEASNLGLAAGRKLIAESIGDTFSNADLFTTEAHYALALSRKGKARLRVDRNKGSNPPPVVSTEHNRARNYILPALRAEPLGQAARPYLHALGITNADGEVVPAGRRKFKQINKFVEVIDDLLRGHPLPAGAEVVDMGSGSGYLTFALYDHLVNGLGLDARVTGVELRPKLVEKGNRIAAENGFDGLNFVEGYIDSYRPERIDLMIALHACDTATDDALRQGLEAGAEIMVVAPCCQKQVRKDLEVPDALRPLLGHGILLERQAAMLTDALRALYLEAAGYRTKLFEFIPLEHTAKNVMITATKGKARPQALEEAETLMERFGVKRHYLFDRN